MAKKIGAWLLLVFVFVVVEKYQLEEKTMWHGATLYKIRDTECIERNGMAKEFYVITGNARTNVAIENQ
jgi:hypothetical protein